MVGKVHAFHISHGWKVPDGSCIFLPGIDRYGDMQRGDIVSIFTQRPAGAMTVIEPYKKMWVQDTMCHNANHILATMGPSHFSVIGISELNEYSKICLLSEYIEEWFGPEYVTNAKALTVVIVRDYQYVDPTVA